MSSICLRKTALITGAGSGIGFAAAEKFLKEGWQVVVLYHNEWPDLDGSILRQKIDFADAGSIIIAAGEISGLFPEIDVLVNCAGAIFDANRIDPDLDAIRKTFETNVFGLIDFTERMLPYIESDGRIINIGSSMGAFSAPPYDAATLGYRMSKAALHMYTRTLAQRMSERDICVSVLDPGWVDTAMGRLFADETARPNRTSAQVADEIFYLATAAHIETGKFWENGSVREW